MDEFLRDRTGSLGFGVQLSPGLMRTVSESLKRYGLEAAMSRISGWRWRQVQCPCKKVKW
jgi:hypothetical protein